MNVRNKTGAHDSPAEEPSSKKKTVLVIVK